MKRKAFEEAGISMEEEKRVKVDKAVDQRVSSAHMERAEQHQHKGNVLNIIVSSYKCTIRVQ